MASVMPAATYPKTYRVNERDYTVKSAAEDTSFQASSLYFSGATVLTYPKTLKLGHVNVTVRSSVEEASARAGCGQA